MLGIGLDHRGLQRTVDAPEAEDEREPIDLRGQVREDPLRLGDRLRLEPVQHPGELGVLERDPRQDGVAQRDARARGLPGRAAIGSELVAGHTCLFELHHEVVLADLRVVVVREVAPVGAGQLAAKRDHVERVLVEPLRLAHVVLVVAPQHSGLLARQHRAHGEGQVLDAVRAHVELKGLQARGSRLVVEVVDQVQIHLGHHAVGGLDPVQPAVILALGADDRLRLAVQGVGVCAPHAQQGVQDRVVEADAVEPDHAGTLLREGLDEIHDLPGVVAPRADLEVQPNGELGVLHGHREDVGVRLQVVDVVVHYRYPYKRGGGRSPHQISPA